MTQTKTREYTAQEQLEIMGITNESLYKEEDVIRDRYTGRIVKGPDGPDTGLNVVFSTEACLSKLKTWENGGVPQYVDMDFITITPPGLEMTFTVHRPVTDYDQWRFPVEYKAWKDGQGAILVGTPLAIWPIMTPSQIKELEVVGIRTVEQVAQLSDSVQGIRSAAKLRQAAKDFLEQAHNTAAQGLLQQQLEESKAEHAAQIAALQAQVAELVKINAAQSAEKATAKK
ncbi:MAG: hypothetical protein V5B36_00890 [Candidatus Accumulibacter sp. UW25]|jgi:hypothetical protein